MPITPIDRPGVQVIQEFQSANPTILVPTMPACVMGPAYQIVEAVEDDGSLNSDALIVMPARLTASFVSSPFEYASMGGNDLVLSVNNRAAITTTFSGSGALTVTQVADEINEAAIPGLLAVVETSGTQQRLVIYTTLTGDQASLQVDAATTAAVLTSLGFTAGYTARGWSGYDNYFHLDPQIADYPDPRSNLDELDIDYETVRVFINDGAGNVFEALRTESFLRGATSAVTVNDDGDGDNLSPYLDFASADFTDQSASITGTVDWNGLTYPGDFGTFTLEVVVDGTPVTVTFASPADESAAISQLNTQLDAAVSGTTAVLDGSNQPVITSPTTGPTSSIEIGDGGTITEATIGLAIGTYGGGSPAPARAQGNADLSALTFGTDVHGRVLRMSYNGDAHQTLTMPASIASAADIVTAITDLWGASTAALNDASELVLTATDSFGGVESVIRIDKDASDATLLTNLGLTTSGAPFENDDAVYGTAFAPLVGDELWVDGVRLGEITEIPVSPVNRLRIDAEQLLTFTGSTWYIQATGLDNSQATATRPSSDLIVDENSGTVRVKHNLFRESDGVVTLAGPLNTYLGYNALRLDVSPEGEDFSLLRFGTTTALEEELAPLDTQNPLGLGMYFAILNAPGVEVTGLGVGDASATEPDGTLVAYTSAFEYLESKDVYAIAPLTHDNTVGQVAEVHVEELSEPENGLERMVILNPSRPTRKTDTLVASGATGNVSGPPTNDIQSGIANLQALLAAQGLPGPTYAVTDEVFVNFEDDTNNYLVESVVGGVITINDGPLASGNEDNFYYDNAGSPVFTTAIVDRPFTVKIRGAAIANLTEEATAYGEIAQGIANRRVVATAPDQAKATIDGLETIIDGYYLSAALAGRVSSKNPQQPLTEESITGFTGVIGSSDRYGEMQLKIMNGGGLFIFYQEADGQPVKIRMQVTTDMSTVEQRELSILTALDFTAKFIRTGLRNFIGRFNITTNIRDAVSITLDGLGAFLLRQGVLGSFEVNAIRQSESDPTELEIDVTLGVLYPLNTIRVTLIV